MTRPPPQHDRGDSVGLEHPLEGVGVAGDGEAELEEDLGLPGHQVVGADPPCVAKSGSVDVNWRRAASILLPAGETLMQAARAPRAARPPAAQPG